MQIGTKFSIAIHILLCVEFFNKDYKVTGDFIAASVKTNPTIIRNIMALLRDAGIIESAAGTGGAKLTRPASDITMRDIYLAVNPIKDGKLFKIHKNTEPCCPVGGNILMLLEPVFFNAQSAMENNLMQSTLQDVLNTLNTKLKTKLNS
ncbi:transcriptional regulator [Spirochaetia bacterium]|nr:transcriptional regulator [Spirochaetia bacterium]